MRPELRRLGELTDSEFARWADLSARAAEANVALDPRFAAPDATGPESEHLLLIAEEDGRWFGLLRVFPTDVPDVPSALRLEGFGTWDPPVAGPCHPVLDGERAAEALATIARGVRRHLRRGYLVLRGYPSDGPLAAAREGLDVRPAMHSRVVGTHAAAWAFPLSADAAVHSDARIGPALIDPDYRSYGSRRVLRTNARRLEGAAGGPLEIHDTSADPAAVDRFLDVQASGWKGDHDRGGTAVALDTRAERAFREKVEAFRSTDDLLVLEMWAGVHCVYSTVIFIAGGVAIGVLDAYQDEFARFSAGSLARTAICARVRTMPRLRGMNPGIYDQYPEASKIYPDRRDFLDVVIGIGSAPSIVTRFAPRAEESRAVGRILTAIDRVDRFALRAAGSIRRRLVRPSR